MIELRESQKLIVQEEDHRRNVLIVSPMGSGKTLATLIFLVQEVYKGTLKNVLIIAPKRVAMSVWVQESEKYKLGLNIEYCKNAADIKMFMITPATHRVCVCSVSRISEIPHGCWDAVILDESTLFGNKSSQRSKEARRLCNRVGTRILLTGTPIHGGYEKLWHQIFLLDGGKALGASLTSFRGSYMRVKYQVQGVVTVYEMDQTRIPDLIKSIKHLVLNVADVVKLPPILEKDIVLDLSTQRRKEYDDLEQSSILSFAAETGMSAFRTDRTIVAFSASARGAKLRQLASGMVYTTDVDENDRSKITGYSVTHHTKIDALQEIVETSERGVMVVYAFKSELYELQKAFPKARTLDTAEDIEAWNSGRIPIILVHPASAGWGLNLQFGGNIIVWFSLTYDAELYAQLNKRLHRSGQTDSVTLAHLIMRGTIDEKIIKVLRRKQEVANDFTNTL